MKNNELVTKLTFHIFKWMEVKQPQNRWQHLGKGLLKAAIGG